MIAVNFYIPVTVCPTRGLLPLPFRIISFVKPIILFDVDSPLVIKERTAVEVLLIISLSLLAVHKLATTSSTGSNQILNFQLQTTAKIVPVFSVSLI
jgi:hypothetical protein